MARHSRSGLRIGRGPILIGALVLSLGAASAGAVRVFSAEAAGRADDLHRPDRHADRRRGAARDAVADPARPDYTSEHRTVAGRCVQVKVETLTPGPGPAGAAAGAVPGRAAPPDVWIPESTTSVALLRARPDSAKVLAVPTPPIATSPLVLAAPADALRLLARLGRRPAAARPTLVAWPATRAAGASPASTTPSGARSRCPPPTRAPRRSATGMLLALVGVLTQTPTPDVSAAAFEARRTRGRRCSGWSRTFLHATAPAATRCWRGCPGQHGRGGGLLGRPARRVRAGRLALRPGQPGDRAATRATRSTASSPPTTRTWCRSGSWVDAADRAAAADFRGWLLSAAVQARLDRFGLRGADGVAGPEDRRRPAGRLDAAADRGAAAGGRRPDRRPDRLAAADPADLAARPVRRVRLDGRPGARQPAVQAWTSPGRRRRPRSASSTRRTRSGCGSSPGSWTATRTTGCWCRSGRPPRGSDRFPEPAGRLRRRRTGRWCRGPRPGSTTASWPRTRARPPRTATDYGEHARGDHRRQERGPRQQPAASLLDQLKQRTTRRSRCTSSPSRTAPGPTGRR